MSGLSQHQSVFRLAKPAAGKNGAVSRPRIRNRQPVSCMACRTRKMKCDRQIPCLACSRRGAAASCNYSNGVINENDGTDKSPKTSEAQLRLQKLENMVSSLMRTATADPGNPTGSMPLSNRSSLQSTGTSSGGRLDSYGTETSYLGATHWATILGDIRDIQGFLEADIPDRGEALPSAVSNGPDLGIDTTQSLTLADACNSLPTRRVADGILSVFFQAGYHQNPIIHSGKFLREYESFWADPSSMSFLWISILFSALWIGSRINQPEAHGSDRSLDFPASSNFLTRAGQALVAGRYRQARPYSVEALLLYGQGKYMQKEDPDADASMIIEISTRLALRMGYHRDPRHLKNISPFEGEMRRRTFHVLEIFDILMSFQAGLPAVIHEEYCDTEPPSNLFDEDFDEQSAILPPSRPETDPTPMLYFSYKSRFAKVLKRVVRHTISPKSPSYEDTLKLDGELHRMHMDVPPSLRARPLDSSFTDPAHTIMKRLNLEVLYLKSLCVLHRTYLIHDKSNPTFAYSRKTCTEAALHLLKFQAEMYIASQPGGRYFNDVWILSSLTQSDFLLAAMITCLDMYESLNSSSATSAEDLKTQAEKYDALQLSSEIWTSKRESSRDGRRASNVLAVMLSKFIRPAVREASENSTQQLSAEPQISSNGETWVSSIANLPESSSRGTYELNTPSQVNPSDQFVPLDSNIIDPLDAILGGTEDIDWELVDRYLFDRNANGDFSQNDHSMVLGRGSERNSDIIRWGEYVLP